MYGRNAPPPRKHNVLLEVVKEQRLSQVHPCTLHQGIEVLVLPAAPVAAVGVNALSRNGIPHGNEPPLAVELNAPHQALNGRHIRVATANGDRDVVVDEECQDSPHMYIRLSLVVVLVHDAPPSESEWALDVLSAVKRPHGEVQI